jgi:cellulose synthase/poly-beta-1,6-N-acetylglucosamine synthase-like glycosyltransferase
MWLVPSVVYWSSLAVVGYTYVGYPLLIEALARLRSRPVRAGAAEPSVSVVLAAYNEEAHIARKLENLLSLDYPRDKLQIIVVSDGSTDRTDEIVAGFAPRGVQLLRVPHGGKPAALNRGVDAAGGEIVLFCDARQRIAQDALRAMAPLFGDPQVGAVVGDTILEARSGPGFYWAYERRIRLAEGAVDSVVGGSGAMMGVRRHLYAPLPPDVLLDDVFTPMQIVLQGYRVLYHPDVRVYDQEASVSGEFSRKARTLAGNYQLLRYIPDILHPAKNRIFVQYMSHKVLRLVCPFALLGLLASNGWLVATGAPGWPWYALTLSGQLAAYGLALRGAVAGEGAGRMARVAHTFVVLNAAAVEGLRRYLRGDLSWTTARRAARAEA